MTDVDIKLVSFADPVAQQMISAALRELASRYGGDGDATPMEPAQFEPPHGAFLVAMDGGIPVACVGWRSHGSDGSVAELKRLYTEPHVRGCGIGRRLLAAIEDSARDAGRKRVILETGSLQPEAIALYESAGYERIENFGYYKDEPDVQSFGRDL